MNKYDDGNRNLRSHNRIVRDVYNNNRISNLQIL